MGKINVWISFSPWILFHIIEFFYQSANDNWMKICFFNTDIIISWYTPQTFLKVIKIRHFFLRNAQYPSLQNSHFGDISPYSSDRSHMKIILTFLFVSSYQWDEKTNNIVCLSFRGSQPKFNKKRISWHSETWLEIDCLLVSQ